MNTNTAPGAHIKGHSWLSWTDKLFELTGLEIMKCCRGWESAEQLQQKFCHMAGSPAGPLLAVKRVRLQSGSNLWLRRWRQVPAKNYRSLLCFSHKQLVLYSERQISLLIDCFGVFLDWKFIVLLVDKTISLQGPFSNHSWAFDRITQSSPADGVWPLVLVL